MIGQTHITAAIAKRVKVSQLTGDSPSHLAFEGSRGMGKTLLMATAAEAFGLMPIETAFKQGTQMDKAINILRNKWRPNSVWIVDELHNLSLPNQMALKKLVETGVYTTNSGDDISLPGLVVFTAFTDRSAIDSELLDRFIVYRLLPYSADERLDILTEYAESKNVSFEYLDAELIATLNQSPRDICKAVDTAYVLQVVGEKVSSNTVFAEQGKDPDGLDFYDRMALKVIADLLGMSVKATLEIVSDKLRISHKATTLVLSRLSSLGYIKATPAIGRTLTNQGWEKVDSMRLEGWI